MCEIILAEGEAECSTYHPVGQDGKDKVSIFDK